MGSHLNSLKITLLTNSDYQLLSQVQTLHNQSTVEQAYTTFEMKSGLTYEHLFGRKTVATLSTGASSMLTSKVLDGKSNTFIKSTQSTVPYIRLGISLLPFWKGLE